MGAQNHTTIDFGAAPGTGGQAVIKTVADASIQTTSDLEAWLRCEGSADHSADEHFCENIRIRAGNIVNTTSFDIIAECTLGTTFGVFNVSWVWN